MVRGSTNQLDQQQAHLAESVPRGGNSNPSDVTSWLVMLNSRSHSDSFVVENLPAPHSRQECVLAW